MLSSRICVQQDFRDQQTAPWMISKRSADDMKDDSSQKTQLTHVLRDGYCDDDNSSDYGSSYYDGSSSDDDDSEYDSDASDYSEDLDYEEIEHEMLSFDLRQMRRKNSYGSSSTLSNLSALTANSAENRPRPSQTQKQMTKAFSCADLFERMAKADATNSYFQDVTRTNSQTQLLPPSKHKHRNTIATSTPSSSEPVVDASRPDQYLKIMLASEYTTESTFESKTWEKYFTAVTKERTEAHNLLVSSTIRKGNLEELRRLAAAGNRLDGCNRQGESNIHMACRLTHHGKDRCLEIIKFLLEEANVSVRVRDDCGKTPLHDACWMSKPNFDLIRYILDKSPELLFLEDFRGHTALHYIPADAWGVWRDWIDTHHEWLQQKVHNSTWLKASDDLDAAQVRMRKLMARAQSFMNSDSE